MKQRILAAKTSESTVKRVSVACWVHARRDHGGLIFIDVMNVGSLAKARREVKEVVG